MHESSARGAAALRTPHSWSFGEMGGGLERVRSISLAPKAKQTLRPLLPPASHNFAPSLPILSYLLLAQPADSYTYS